MGAGSHWLLGASLLAGTHPTLGQVRLLGRGPSTSPCWQGLLQGARARSCLPIKAGQTMPEMQGHMLPGYCLREREREREKARETSPHSFSWACRHLESLGPAAAAQYHTGTLSCRGRNPFRPVSAHPSRSVRRQPHPSSAPRTRERGHQAAGGGEPREQSQGARCLGWAPRGSGGSWKHVAASLLALLVLLSFSLSAL